MKFQEETSEESNLLNKKKLSRLKSNGKPNKTPKIFPQQ